MGGAHPGSRARSNVQGSSATLPCVVGLTYHRLWSGCVQPVGRLVTFEMDAFGNSASTSRIRSDKFHGSIMVMVGYIPATILYHTRCLRVSTTPQSASRFHHRFRAGSVIESDRSCTPALSLVENPQTGPIQNDCKIRYVHRTVVNKSKFR